MLLRLGWTALSSSLVYKMVQQITNSDSSLSSSVSLSSPSLSPSTSSYDLRGVISNLFTKNVQILADSYRGRDQFAKVKGLYLFEIHSQDWGEPVHWTVDLKLGETYPGKPVNDSQPDTTYLIEAQDMIALLTGRLDSAKAYLSGKLKLVGNMAAAFKFQHFINEAVADSKATKSMKQSTNEPQPMEDPFAPVLESIPTDGLKCDVVFDFIRSRLALEPELVAKLPFVIQVNVTKDKVPVTVWTIDTKSPGGRVYRSTPLEGVKPDASLTIEDDEYINLLFGKLNPQRAFMKGLVKVKGNIMLLQRLDTMWNQIQRSRRDPELPFVKELLLGTQLRKGLRSEIVFFDLIERLVRMPSLLPGGMAVKFNITKDGQQQSQWLIGYNQIGAFSLLKHQSRDHSSDLVPIGGSAQLELTLDDDDFVRLSRDPSFKLQDAIATSRVQLTGDETLVVKLDQLFQRIPVLQSKL